MLRHPHLILIAPSVIRAPYLQADGILAAGFGDENALSRVWNLRARDDHDSFGNTLVDENPIAFLHRYPVVFSAPAGHAAKLSPGNSTGNDFTS